jgi:hypothetical protein
MGWYLRKHTADFTLIYPELFAFYILSLVIFSLHQYLEAGYAVAQLVEALRYKPEGRGFDSRSSH